jgi:hypothetical protein
MRPLGSCKLTFKFAQFYHIILTTPPQPPSTFCLTFDILELIIPYGHKVQNIPKVAAEDTTLTVTNADGGKTTFPIVSGTEIDLHAPGLHYNRKPSVCRTQETDSHGVS